MTTHLHPRRRPLKRQKGLTIVELMIAMALSLLLGIGVFQVFQANQSSARLTQSLSEVQEIGRLASELIARDVRNADYWGCAGDLAQVNSTIDPTGIGYDPVQHGFGQPGQDSVTALNDVPSGTQEGGVDVIVGTDVLRMQSLAGRGISISQSMPLTSSALFVVNNWGFEEGDVLAVSDCRAADVFQVTNFNPSGGGASGFNVVHNAGGSTQPGNSTQNFSQQYDAGAQILIPVYRAFFLNEDADGVPRLMMHDESGAVNVLADWVEDMQLIFGADSDADEIVDTFGSVADLAAAGLSMDQVLSVQVNLRIASRETNVVETGIAYAWNNDQALTTAEDQGRLRRMFTANASIRSRLP